MKEHALAKGSDKLRWFEWETKEPEDFVDEAVLRYANNKAQKLKDAI